tara:strand:+ start:218 stop:1405 length:1188 start_codon:yes stop_codon:yes gene_type:complete
MGIGSFLYENLGIISPELGLSGAPTNSIFWLFIFIAIMVFYIIKMKFLFLYRERLIKLLIFFGKAGIFLLFISLLSPTGTNRYSLPPYLLFVISWASLLGYIGFLLIGILISNPLNKIIGVTKKELIKSQRKEFILISFYIFIWLFAWISSGQKGSPFINSFYLIFAPMIFDFLKSINLNNIKNFIINFKLISLMKPFSFLLVFLSLSIFLFNNLVNNITIDQKGDSKNEIIAAYLYSRVARQGQLFSESFRYNLYPNSSNDIFSQLISKKWGNQKSIGMKGVMDHMMPSELRYKHTGSLTMLFPAIIISTTGKYLSLPISLLFVFLLTKLQSISLNFLINNKNALFLVSFLLIFKYSLNILARGDIANLTSPYFVLATLFIISCIIYSRSLNKS